MTPKLLFCFALTVFTAQCAVVRNEESLKRSARSPCDTCGGHGGPPPPPPPPPPLLFRTQNWSGVARSRDGQQGVFSGASAAAGEQAAGEAFSLAAASGGVQQRDEGDQQRGGKFDHFHNSPQSYGSHEGFSSQYQGGQFDNVAQKQQPGFGSDSNGQRYSQQSYGFSGGSSSQNQGGSYNDVQKHQQSGFNSGSSAHRSDSSKAISGNGRTFGQHQAGQYNNNDQQRVQSESGRNTADSGNDKGFLASGQNQLGGQQSLGGSAFNTKSSAQSSASYGSGSNGGSSGYSSHGNQHGSSGRQTEFIQRGDQGQDAQGIGSNVGGSGYSGGHLALGGALELAKQGLQAQQSGSGCSTCGKSSYALSNAKSDSGSAVAVSIGR